MCFFHSSWKLYLYQKAGEETCVFNRDAVLVFLSCGPEGYMYFGAMQMLNEPHETLSDIHCKEQAANTVFGPN